jgi:hypothetical protein
MYFYIEMAHFFGSIMTWGFLMALLFNIFGTFVGFKQGYSLIIASSVMFVSYFLTDHFVDLGSDGRLYLNWALLDVFTLLAIIAFHVILKIKHHRAVYYVVIGLVVNSILFYGIYLDLWVYENTTEWWFWSFYSMGVNVMDYMMVISLVIGKDWLGLVRFGRFIRNKATVKKDRFIEKQKEKRLSQALLQA